MSTLSDRVWSDILIKLRHQNPELVRPWFNALDAIDINNGIIRIPTSDAAQYADLTQSCQSAITSAAQAVTGRLVTIKFMTAPPAPILEMPLSFDSEPENIILNPDYT